MNLAREYFGRLVLAGVGIGSIGCGHCRMPSDEIQETGANHRLEGDVSPDHSRLPVSALVNNGHEVQQTEDAPYRIVGREPDGTTLVEIELVDFRVETRRRTVDHDGQAVEQTYEAMVPFSQLVTVSIPAGEQILPYLDKLYPVTEVEEDAPFPPSLPGSAEDIVPMAPPVPERF